LGTGERRRRRRSVATRSCVAPAAALGTGERRRRWRKRGWWPGGAAVGTQADSRLGSRGEDGRDRKSVEGSGLDREDSETTIESIYWWAGGFGRKLWLRRRNRRNPTNPVN
jgi:hypothetical protein